jgi:hypothetical protein
MNGLSIKKRNSRREKERKKKEKKHRQMDRRTANVREIDRWTDR